MISHHTGLAFLALLLDTGSACRVRPRHTYAAKRGHLSIAPEHRGLSRSLWRRP
ncbi:hypothetical protein IE81DRAFT_319665 [Ceraceosorus guamensis]|uniref:Uncharacterized protein n=1 Tax=Ceraceosorus guamensis TaxID=1522189 RepID=A0A316W9S7_9BASI|nr:hypothetical protein IE81DRAFT_319665 [Ceraceosorus guamensis]PWN45828.1 hypothetical protein IE81DRAFT_319665 [Ceraceosorus guamensis]